MRAVKACATLVALSLSMLPIPQPAAASLLFCKRPAAPTCPYLGAFNDEIEFNSCKFETEDYQRKVKTYINCLREESDATLKEYNRVIDRFNCYAGGGQFC